MARAREQGVALTGPGGLLKQLTKTVLETALNQEMTEHLGHDKNSLAGTEPTSADHERQTPRPALGLIHCHEWGWWGARGSNPEPTD